MRRLPAVGMTLADYPVYRYTASVFPAAANLLSITG